MDSRLYESAVTLRNDIERCRARLRAYKTTHKGAGEYAEQSAKRVIEECMQQLKELQVEFDTL